MAEFTSPSLVDALADDPDFKDVDLTDPDEPTDLDLIAAELGGDVDQPTTTLVIPGRDGWTSVHRLDFTGKDLDGVRRQAKDKKFSDGVDGVKFAALLLAVTCVRLERRGEPIVLGGKAATYVSRDLQDALGCKSAQEAVRKVYGQLEGNIDAAGRKVIEDAGWGDDAIEAGPTL